jgi:hypothetical protein
MFFNFARHSSGAPPSRPTAEPSDQPAQGRHRPSNTTIAKPFEAGTARAEIRPNPVERAKSARIVMHEERAVGRDVPAAARRAAARVRRGSRRARRLPRLTASSRCRLPHSRSRMNCRSCRNDRNGHGKRE